ncbi:unnamed protein product [Cuscuta europaea]|uniref:RING-type domain-containing protein n=1 Tax=Cuscuta europaea TaxID=41803 RepID=A0A9P0Z5Y5_CUSEU|nr:unnamed protein product [Cuscuta europaea]
MGQQQSKDELLYQQVNYGNIEGIKTLRSDGAGLEWVDKEGKTPLILACMNPQLYNVASTLIELGANVNAYRAGRHAGTPLHHAAKRGLEKTINLLLSHGANALVINDDCQTPLDVARVKGFSNVVRAIESHICLFSGWLRELYGPEFLDLLVPKLLWKKVWVVVLPCASRRQNNPFKWELAVYGSQQDAQPRTVVALWKANLEEPNFSHSVPAVVISDISTIPRCWRRRRGIMSSQLPRHGPRGARQVRVKLTAVEESDKQLLHSFWNACKGIPQVSPQALQLNIQLPVLPATAPPALEDVELAMAISASMQPVVQRPSLYANSESGATASTSWTNPDVVKAGPSGSQIQHSLTPIETSVIQTKVENPIPEPTPSAPIIAEEETDEGPIHYPSLDVSPVGFSCQNDENITAAPHKDKDQADATCVICLDAPVEGACVPCGHMAGCMSCLADIKAKRWGCPVCRAKIDQVIKLYAV